MKISKIKEMELLAKNTRRTVSLSQGVPHFYSDAAIRKDVFKAIKANKVDKYEDPQGLRKLRQLISRMEQNRGAAYSQNEILVTAGAMEGLMVTLLALFTKGDEIMIPSPSYVSFFKAAAIASLTVRNVVLDESSNWSLDIKKLQDLINKKTRAVLLCHPNNPTGTVYSPETLEKICRLTEAYNLTLIVDEVYEHIYFGKIALYHPHQRNRFKKR
ncbi:pyridoxal phosphate-dependent aminotransferase, partial [Candidatus Roizmanbacteria bacterium]|nr:pyridoxal phosphate-dependent aminotransferase [Candidatus Roizmanbacteria bacterium]